MREDRRGLTLGSIALLLSLIAFTLGSAPFAPAIVLGLLAIPLALLAALLGSWRLSLVSFYFANAAWLVVPTARALQLRIDYALVLFALFGLLIAVGLCCDYRRRKRQLA